MLKSATECHHFLESQDAVAIAEHIRRDQTLCKNRGLPSILAWYLPPATTRLGNSISIHLDPDNVLQDESLKQVRHLRYDSVVQSIKAYLNQMNQDTLVSNGENQLKLSAIVPTTREFETALKVLDYLQDHRSMLPLTSSSPLADAVAAIEEQISINPELRSEYRFMAQTSSSMWHKEKTRNYCYICRFKFTRSHRLYPALCLPCGNFNLAGSEASLPENLDLTGMTALVTGGRVHLGYHTVIRLLRCGARVIASSRYPRDAETKYQKEPDFEDWAHRLRIVGADFRSAKDAFRLIHVVKKVLSQWKDDGNGGKFKGLNILINNAAQTLTDPLKSESRAANKEECLQTKTAIGSLLVDDDNGYQARVKGGMAISWSSKLEGPSQFLLENVPGNNVEEFEHAKHPPQKGLRGDIVLEEDGGKSSWTQTLQEIPYEDMISAHSVNAFVPLILCRELLPLMAMGDELTIGSPTEAIADPEDNTTTQHAATVAARGYIINISSREGLFEETPDHSQKAGRHVHTNMSKAAINMITETEAAHTWTMHRVAMNTVDPGYMSAAPEYQRSEGCPIGFEDGAARVLWPIVVGVKHGAPVWGRFLKHFGEVNAQTGRARGTG
ncbi:hypothetical protein AJ79_06524 [Helicocarpus griseus UAMH5409]|uniref:Uncharacterized protein n=1 Tax=Helicocarpus griseus UAMH5409 TaxID=1447875 RepID=A0A2B7X467_9EURO|nr:hypothetical protein AJ79_06524 [Helicocarpus griseus UAMH5409]